MKKAILVAFLFCLNSSIVNAEGFVAQIPVVCTTLKELIDTLKTKHEELPIMLGEDSSNNTKYGMFFNGQTKTWTFIQFDKEDACILGFGKEGKLTLGKKV